MTPKSNRGKQLDVATPYALHHTDIVIPVQDRVAIMKQHPSSNGVYKVEGLARVGQVQRYPPARL